MISPEYGRGSLFFFLGKVYVVLPLTTSHYAGGGGFSDRRFVRFVRWIYLIYPSSLPILSFSSQSRADKSDGLAYVPTLSRDLLHTGTREGQKSTFPSQISIPFGDPLNLSPIILQLYSLSPFISQLWSLETKR
jgi:hypothetical protein